MLLPLPHPSIVASRALTNLAMQSFAAPGQGGWHLGTLFPGGVSAQETGEKLLDAIFAAIYRCGA